VNPIEEKKPVAAKRFVRATFIPAACICFAFTPIAAVVAIMASDAGVTFLSEAAGALIVALPIGLGISLLLSRKWLERNPSYMIYGVVVGCLIVLGFVWIAAQYLETFAKLLSP
jgi:hypothetical protein